MKFSQSFESHTLSFEFEFIADVLTYPMVGTVGFSFWKLLDPLTGHQCVTIGGLKFEACGTFFARNDSINILKMKGARKGKQPNMLGRPCKESKMPYSSKTYIQKGTTGYYIYS